MDGGRGGGTRVTPCCGAVHCAVCVPTCVCAPVAQVLLPPSKGLDSSSGGGVEGDGPAGTPKAKASGLDLAKALDMLKAPHMRL